MAFVTVESNQSIWDIAIQVYGDCSGVEQLMLDNPGVVNFSEALIAGTKLVVNGAVINKNIVDYFAKKDYKPTHASSLDDLMVGGAFDSGFSIGFNI